MTKRVHCEDCKYFEDEIYEMNGWLVSRIEMKCHAHENIISGDWKTSKYKGYKHLPSEINKDCMCQWYEYKGGKYETFQ